MAGRPSHKHRAERHAGQEGGGGGRAWAACRAWLAHPTAYGLRSHRFEARQAGSGVAAVFVILVQSGAVG